MLYFSAAIVMDLVASVLVRRKDDLYLFVHGANKQLELPSQQVADGSDIVAAALMLLEEVIVTVVHNSNPSFSHTLTPQYTHVYTVPLTCM